MAADSDGRVVVAGISDGLYTADAKADANSLNSTSFLVLSLGTSSVTADTGSSDADTTPIIAWVVGVAVFAAVIALWVFMKRRNKTVDEDDA